MNSAEQRKISNLRVNSFAALVILLIEIGVGIGVNLFATLPTDDAGKSLFAAFGTAVTNGPLVLTLHALLGTIILISIMRQRGPGLVDAHIAAAAVRLQAQTVTYNRRDFERTPATLVPVPSSNP